MEFRSIPTAVYLANYLKLLEPYSLHSFFSFSFLKETKFSWMLCLWLMMIWNFKGMFPVAESALMAAFGLTWWISSDLSQWPPSSGYCHPASYKAQQGCPCSGCSKSQVDERWQVLQQSLISASLGQIPPQKGYWRSLYVSRTNELRSQEYYTSLSCPSLASSLARRSVICIDNSA